MRKVVTGLILVVAVALSGCGGPPPPEELTAEEVAQAALEAADNVETYQFDMAMNMATTAVAPEPMEASMALEGDGAVDNVDREMRVDVAMRLEFPEEAAIPVPGEMETEMYLVGGTAYSKMTMFGMPAQWVKMEMPQGYWETQSPTETQVRLLEGAEVELLREEQVKGVDCYLLRVTPDLEKLWQAAIYPQGLLGAETEMPDLQEVIKSFSVKYWIAKDTYFLTKVDAQMVLPMSSEDMGFPQEVEEEFEIAVDMSMTSNFYNYNQPVTIVLPPEAEGAIEVPRQD